MTRAFSAIGRERLRQLASTLDGNVVLPGDAAYDEAIRGGGGNFGIVTSFEYRLVRLDSVLSGLLYLPSLPSGGGHSRLPRLDGGRARRIADCWWPDGHAARPGADGVYLLLRRSREGRADRRSVTETAAANESTPCRPARTRRVLDG